MKIGIIGLGMVGNAIKYGMEKLGHRVCFYDPAFVNSEWESILDTDLNFICVPTKANEDNSCDTSIVESVIDKLVEDEYEGLMVIKSTVTPGTTQKLINKHSIYRICFVPEFLRERCAETDFMENHDICIIGTEELTAFETIKEAHGRYPKKFLQLKPTEAEFCKYFNNVYNATLVTFANSMYEVCKAMNVDYSAVKNAIVQRDHITDIYLDCNEKFRGYAGPCVSPNTLIYTQNGLIPISQIQEGDMVLTHTGQYQKVLKQYKTPYQGNLLKIKPQGTNNDIYITPNHPVLGQQNNRKLYYTNGRWKLSSTKSQDIELKWINSQNLTKGDFVVLPIPEEGQQETITKEQARLLGYYLAEGSISSEFRVSFAFHRDEKEYHNDVITLAKSQFNVELIPQYENKKCALRRTSKELGLFLYSLGGQYSHLKRMPWEFLINSTNEILTEVLIGYFRGDGSLTNDTYVCATVSKELFEQLKYVFMRLGIPVSTHTQTQHIGKDGTKHRETYYISIKSHIYMSMFSRILKDSYTVTEKTAKTPMKIFNEKLLYPIKSIEQIPYEGLVYNLEVDQDESYVTYGFTVHNCLIKDTLAMKALAAELGTDVKFFEFIDNENNKYPKTVWEGMRL